MVNACSSCKFFITSKSQCGVFAVTVPCEGFENCKSYESTRRCGECERFTITDHLLFKGHCLNFIGKKSVSGLACDEFVERQKTEDKSDRVKSRFELLILE